MALAISGQLFDGLYDATAEVVKYLSIEDLLNIDKASPLQAQLAFPRVERLYSTYRSSIRGKTVARLKNVKYVDDEITVLHDDISALKELPLQKAKIFVNCEESCPQCLYFTEDCEESNTQCLHFIEDWIDDKQRTFEDMSILVYYQNKPCVLNISNNMIITNNLHLFHPVIYSIIFNNPNMFTLLYPLQYNTRKVDELEIYTQVNVKEFTSISADPFSIFFGAHFHRETHSSDADDATFNHYMSWDIIPKSISTMLTDTKPYPLHSYMKILIRSLTFNKDIESQLSYKSLDIYSPRYILILLLLYLKVNNLVDTNSNINFNMPKTWPFLQLDPTMIRRYGTNILHIFVLFSYVIPIGIYKYVTHALKQGSDSYGNRQSLYALNGTNMILYEKEMMALDRLMTG